VPHDNKLGGVGMRERTINNNCGKKYINFSSVVEKIKALKSDGYSLVLHRFKSKGKIYFYIKARKTVNGKRKEITVARVSQKEAEELKRLGLVSKRNNGRKVYKGKSESPNNNTTTSAQPSDTSNIKNFADSSGGFDPQSHFKSFQSHTLSWHDCARMFRVHKLGLYFSRPWVSRLYLSSIGYKVKYISQSKQYIVKIPVGSKRVLTLQVNSNGTAQVWLEASDNPLTIDEFLGFCRFYLIELFRRITGREVSLSDFYVMTAPELNVDLNGVVLEGVKGITLENYYGDLVRIYYSEDKETMPDGGTRVEVRAYSWASKELNNIVDGLFSLL